MNTNTLSNDIGSWDKLAKDAAKYPSLVATAEWLKQYENTPLPIPDFVTSAKERQCPVAEHRPVVKAQVMMTKESNTSRLWNMLHHCEHGLVAIPATEGLNDLAFDKGWRIVHSQLEEYEVPRYTNRFDARQMDMAEFYLTYLEDTEMTEDSAEFFGDIIRPLYEAEQSDNLGAAPDADEEDFDEFYSVEDIAEDDEGDF